MRTVTTFACLLFVVGLWGAQAHAEQLIQKPECSIAIPDGWREMPREVLDEYERNLMAAAPGAARQHYNYGFQSPDKAWFEYPYILVQRIDSGRIPESQLSQLESKQVTDEIDKQGKAYGPLLSDLSVGKPVYDRQQNILWLTIEANVASIGTITGIAGMVPTQKGLMQACGYAPKADFATHEPDFRRAILSLTPAQDLVYRPSFGSGAINAVLPSNPILRNALIWGIAGGIIGVVFTLIRRKSA